MAGRREKIKVFIVDDHAMVRTGIRDTLDGYSDIEVVGEAGSGVEALGRIGPGISLAIIDISLPDINGIELMRQLKLKYPGLPFLMLSMHDEKHYAINAMKSGASAYVSKSSVIDELVTAIMKVASGGRYLSQSLYEEIALSSIMGKEQSPHEILSVREMQTLQGLASGMGLGEIAALLNLSVKTVSTYRARILEKLDLSSNADIVKYALKHGLIQE